MNQLNLLRRSNTKNSQNIPALAISTAITANAAVALYRRNQIQKRNQHENLIRFCAASVLCAAKHGECSPFILPLPSESKRGLRATIETLESLQTEILEHPIGQQAVQAGVRYNFSGSHQASIYHQQYKPGIRSDHAGVLTLVFNQGDVDSEHIARAVHAHRHGQVQAAILR